MIDAFGNTRALIDRLEPDEPLVLYHPGKARDLVDVVGAALPGHLAYGLETCRQELLLSDLERLGVSVFFASSLDDIALARAVARSASVVMGGLFKARLDIREAYHEHGVRVFTVAHESEAIKILEMTEGAADITFVLQIAPRDPHSNERAPILDEREAVALVGRFAKRQAKIGFALGSWARFYDLGEIVEAFSLMQAIIAHTDVRPHIVCIDGLTPDMDRRRLAETLRGCIGSVKLRPDAEIVVRADACLEANVFSGLFRIVGRRERTLFIQADEDLVASHSGADRIIAHGFGRPLRGQRTRFTLMSSFSRQETAMPNEVVLPADIERDDYLELPLSAPSPVYGAAYKQRRPVVILAE